MVQFYSPGNRPWGNQPGDICAFDDGVYLATDAESAAYLLGQGLRQSEKDSMLFISRKGEELRRVRERYRDEL